MIWNLQNTIALRNILIYGSLPLSLLYVYQCFQSGWFSKSNISWKSWLPFITIPCIFILVLSYYLNSPEDPALQWRELTSVWARAGAGSILAFAVGLVVRRHPSWIQILGLGLGLVAIILIAEALPGTLVTRDIFYGTRDVLNNLVGGKVYGALVGTIYIAGLLGFISDKLQAKSFLSRSSLTVALVIAVTILYSYVFVLDTRNGLGIALILIIAWFSLQLIFNLKPKASHFRSGKLLKLTFISIAIFSVMGMFAIKQFQHNPQWPNFIEDVNLSVQIDRHSTWRNDPAIQAYPKTPDGHVVAISTYLRAAWFVAGISMIPSHPFSSGILYRSFGRELKKIDPESSVTTSHSAWVDYALSLGYVGLLFLWWPLLLAFILSWVCPSPLSSVVRWVTVGLFLIYALGELFTGTSVEFLFFWLTFLPTVLLPLPLEDKNKLFGNDLVFK
jgi:hypothetical protein